MKCSRIYLFSALLLFLISVPVLLVNAQSASAASSVLRESEQAFVSTYEAIMEAEQAGANISTLLDKCNVASDYLAEANVWYRMRDFGKAIQFAGLSSEALEGVSDEAFDLKVEAEKVNEADFFAAVLVSVAGVVAVLVFCSVTWLVFKRHYQKMLI